MGNGLRDWTMAVLMFVFILLYGAVLLGWLRPLPGEQMAARLEPIIFVFIGYYFSRFPSQQNERALKEEIIRQTQKADAAQHVKEQEQQAREMLEEKLKNVRATLTPFAAGESRKHLGERADGADGGAGGRAVRHSVEAALNILNS
jgi:hypothetical protein